MKDKLKTSESISDDEADLSSKPKKDKKKRKSEEYTPGPSPINKVKMANKINGNEDRTSSTTDNERDEETMMPTPIQIKPEKTGKKSADRDVPVPNPINIKIEKRRKRNLSESEISSDDENDDLVPAPIKAKKESRKRRRSTSNQSDDDTLEVPLPKIIKTESPGLNSNSNSGESSSDEDTVHTKMEYLNNSTEQTPKKKNSWIEKIQAKYPNTVKHQITSELPDVNNVFLLRVPKTIDPSKLLNLPWDLNRNLKFKLIDRKEKYVIKPVKESPGPCFVLSHEAKILDVDKIYTVSRHISKKRTPEFVQPISTTVALPENLKVRHPLFGASYKSKIKLSNDVKRRLKEATDNLKKQNAKQMKKKKSKKIKEETDKSSELIFDMLNSHTSRKMRE